ncbi:Vi polysaccharide biosynthesis UDP-N-acetylglucosamine C-6 dehydrogenase TviB [Alkalilimnicola sp. S0819]|uniref:Vi polysaccharide biosynthesis UDP-N-acetylglucosamine C-6 dehydrogenase TviB n=1 Tax=Alkalilimnicola sp. S0819 TaxID=2613922 RepID=UPI0012626B5E|nr:Vi polysaccharide biosynthesis UDP-N-acetylglucosamine C-6 dehydrogenase TviB [Alkalilimnicola sp. S0819]KAB7622913.1 Vi polysaccharide biosynthesis UDP-N-acetylglucosamine C-6 dehydrogenase TviB [Alkalilimnicola sp. S0819]MPQ17237.1 Vi polysaccharide biosynthesis UDP-N-acetylglucosamine C-6 dehydrogenase TviB [Alkalilimnicola sp. S0819]
MLKLDEARVAVVGLGYVGLPLAVELARAFPVIGFDVKAARIAELREGRDGTREVSPEELRQAEGLHYTDQPEDLADCNVYIVTVPTPIDRYKQPDLEPLRRASETVGRLLNPGDVVIYESTVYPGATEEVCVPILERESGLRYLKDIHVGYSPERINPGDREHRISTIRKVTSGSSPEAAEFVDAFYSRVIRAGTHLAPSIAVAEAAKVIENTQRDVNIALVNELALLFNRLGIDTQAVLEAAGSKWNFLPFRPGLVGGHCIGVDPYYLTRKAQEIGHHPEMILAGRRINDHMGFYVAAQVARLMTQKRIHVVGSRILVLGLAFKENCPDLRNTRVVDVVREFEAYHAQVDVYDPNVDPDEARAEYDISPVSELCAGKYDAVVIAVAHEQFHAMGAERIRALLKPTGVIYDIKYLLTAEQVDGRL